MSRPPRALAPLLLAVAVAAPAAPAPAAERGGDGRFDSRRSPHFVLHQDVDIDRRSGWHGSVRFERAVLGALEGAYDRLDRHLGLRPRRPITVVIYDPRAFDAHFARLFRFPAAGFYRSRIHVRGDTRLTRALERVLHHELVHAALHEAAPSYAFPAWLNEGLAEWFEARALGRRGLGTHELFLLAEAQRNGTWLPLAALSLPTLAHLDPEHANLAYLEAHGFVSYLAGRAGERSLGELCDAVIRTRALERAVRRVFGRDLARLEQEFAASVAAFRAP